jgi:hypothetical protein
MGSANRTYRYNSIGSNASQTLLIVLLDTGSFGFVKLIVIGKPSEIEVISLFEKGKN